MIYLDLFSGIGGFHLGILQAGVKIDKCYFSEVDKYATQIYKKHFPDSIELGDIRNIKPEESEGFVSVQQIRQAKANVDSALSQPQGTPVPFPPSEADDHVAKLEVYTSIKALLDKAGQISDTLDQLIQMQAALLQQAQEQEARPGSPVKLQKPVAMSS